MVKGNIEVNENKVKKFAIRKYKEDYKQTVEDLFTGDKYVKDDILGCLEKWPNCGKVVTDNEKVVAVGVFTGAGVMSTVLIYVKECRRREGIGTLLADDLEKYMRKRGVKKIVCDFEENTLHQDVMYKRGYKNWFYSNLMSYSGGKLEESQYNIRNYEDKDYDMFQLISSYAFHKMRLQAGMESTLSLPSEEERSDYREMKDNIFILEDNSKMIGGVILVGNEIGGLVVDIEEQGKGYGRAIMSHVINRVLERGEDKVTLWVLEESTAKVVYEKIGFVKERMHEFVYKNI